MGSIYSAVVMNGVLTLVADQFDFMDRDPIEPPAVTTNKDGVYQCKKHASAGGSFP